jgi:Tfp pilus assembly protein PilE
MELTLKDKIISVGRGIRHYICLELILVVCILGVVTAIAAPRYGETFKRAGVAEAVSRLSSIMTASKFYYYKAGRWPRSQQEVGYYADFAASEYFAYCILTDRDVGEGFALKADGFEVDGMKQVVIVMSCTDISAENVIEIQYHSPRKLI